MVIEMGISPLCNIGRYDRMSEDGAMNGPNGKVLYQKGDRVGTLKELNTGKAVKLWWLTDENEKRRQDRKAGLENDQQTM